MNKFIKGDIVKCQEFLAEILGEYKETDAYEFYSLKLLTPIPGFNIGYMWNESTKSANNRFDHFIKDAINDRRDIEKIIDIVSI